ncbi:MAG: exonuclease subunit SbcD [Defluviitaleaceae bacterium]|nr:exonuclease subunit SbcD [Defluviitaleaceae bacterium]
MKILHTSDWHLGASLGQFSRIEEQKAFIEELSNICVDEEIDIILVAGDIFDNSNPSAAAQALYFWALRKLKRIPIVVIAGNHDSPERLAAPNPLTAELGIATIAFPNAKIKNRQYDGFKITDLGAGCVEICKNGETAIVAALPYVSERRLGEIIFDTPSDTPDDILEKHQMQKNYSEKIGELLSKSAENFRPDAANIIMGHFHLINGKSSQGLERDIILGGIFAVSGADLPQADYIALGHLHRSQTVRISQQSVAHYSGSPLYFGLNERNYQKSVWIAEFEHGNLKDVRRACLKSEKCRKIELWEFNSTAEALERCVKESEAENPAWIFIKISGEQNTTLSIYENKEMRRLQPRIVDIFIDTVGTANANIDGYILHLETREERSDEEKFVDFYAHKKGSPPNDEIRAIFAEILHGKIHEMHEF